MDAGRQDAETWLEDYRRRVDDIAERAREARDALSGLRASASSANGAVSVTVDASGGLCQLSFTERADELPRPRLAEAVLDAVRRARAEAGRRASGALRPLVGDAGVERYLPAPEPRR